MATIQDIARMSGYSIGTVSRVLNNRADVSEEARSRIEEVIREQDYQPNSNARMLRQSISPETSIIVRGTSNSFLHSVLERVQILIREHGETANVLFTRDEEDEVAAAIQSMQHQKPKGLIFLGGSIGAFRRGFDKINVPSVLLLGNAESLGFDNLSSFYTDDMDAAAHAVSMLVSKGHRKIGILGGYPGDTDESASDPDPAALRIQGAVNELRKNGIAFDLTMNYEPCPFTAEEGYRAAEELLLRNPDLTGIFAISDAVAFGAMRALQDMGLTVPKDISTVGFDGIGFTKYSIPRLATIQQDVDTIARKGVNDLLMRISYECPAVHEKIPYRFVHGESVAQPRQ